MMFSKWLNGSTGLILGYTPGIMSLGTYRALDVDLLYLCPWLGPRGLVGSGDYRWGCSMFNDPE